MEDDPAAPELLFVKMPLMNLSIFLSLAEPRWPCCACWASLASPRSSERLFRSLLSSVRLLPLRAGLEACVAGAGREAEPVFSLSFLGMSLITAAMLPPISRG